MEQFLNVGIWLNCKIPEHKKHNIRRENENRMTSDDNRLDVGVFMSEAFTMFSSRLFFSFFFHSQMIFARVTLFVLVLYHISFLSICNNYISV